MFDKRCHKVMDTIEKRERKINNEGQMNALRRLPPGEREKLKQKAEAEQHGDWHVCPADVKATDKSVPHCCQCMWQIAGTRLKDGGEAAMESEPSGSKPPPPPARAPPPPVSATAAASSAQDQSTAAGPAQDADSSPRPALLDDTMLVVLRKDKDDELMAVEDEKQKKKGKVKKGKEKMKRVLPLGQDYDIQQMLENDVEETPAPAAAVATNPWNRNLPALTGEQERKIKDFQDLTSCTAQQAKELLEKHKWVAQRAADEFFESRGAAGGTKWGRKVAATPGQTATTTTSKPPAWGRPLGGVVGPGHVASTAAAPTLKESAAAAGAASAMATAANRIIRNCPAAAAAVGANPAGVAAGNSAATAMHTNGATEVAAVDGDVSQPQEVDEGSPVEDAGIEQAALPTQPPPPKVPENWRAIWSEEHQTHYYWNTDTNETTWDCPALDDGPAKTEEVDPETAENQRRQALVEDIMQQTGFDEVRVKRRLQAQQWDAKSALIILKKDLEREKKALSASVVPAKRSIQEQGEIFPSDGPWQLICTRHWSPKRDLAGMENTLCVQQGDRISVTWIDETDTEGWAYGQRIHDGVAGYVPQVILDRLQHTPKARDTGEVCQIRSRFEAPTEVDGYLSVAKGDKVRVLCPMEDSLVWAYGARISEGGEFAEEASEGWLPEAVLADADQNQVE